MNSIVKKLSGLEIFKKEIAAGSASAVNQLAAYVLGCELGEVNEKLELASDKQLNKISKLVKQHIIKHRPVQLIIGDVEFLNCKIAVRKGVLIPRNETELLADIVVKHVNKAYKGKQIKVLDMCCGSGALGVAIAKNMANVEVVLADINAKAIRLAKKNIKKNNVRVQVIKSNLFQNINNKFNIVVCNPPYIPSGDVVGLDAVVIKNDPILALDGGNDGLDFYRRIESVIDKYLEIGGELFLEFGRNQENDIQNIFANKLENVRIIKDYNNINRFFYGKLKEKDNV